MLREQSLEVVSGSLHSSGEVYLIRECLRSCASASQVGVLSNSLDQSATLEESLLAAHLMLLQLHILLNSR